MKKLELECFGVQELDAGEMKEVNGGLWWQVVVAYVLLEALLNPEAHINAFMEGLEAGKNS
jgi:hypothetical protein